MPESPATPGHPGPGSPAAEDAKLVTLARAALARTGSVEAAAVRDRTGRTYVATTVSLPSLKLAALEGAVAAAVSSGAEGIEAAAVVRSGSGPVEGIEAVRDLGSAPEPAPVLVADSKGRLREVLR